MHKEKSRNNGQCDLLDATGLSPGSMEGPFVGIASSFSDLVPGHTDMRSLERFSEKGIYSAGGKAFIFGISIICDGITIRCTGMHYSLPSGELIADSKEPVAIAPTLDWG